MSEYDRVRPINNEVGHRATAPLLVRRSFADLRASLAAVIAVSRGVLDVECCEVHNAHEYEVVVRMLQ